jgi:hypothetical protein
MTMKDREMMRIHTHKVSEVHIDLDVEALLQTAKSEGVDWIIIRVQTFGRSGRPSSRTLRLHKDQLIEPDIDYTITPGL